MAGGGERAKVLTRRVAIVGGLQGLLVTALGARLFNQTVTDSDKYRLQADQNRLSVRLLAPPRGLIVDRFGRELAGNRRDFRVLVIPEQTGDLEATLNTLFARLELDPAPISKIIKQAASQKKFFPVLAASNLTWEQFAAVNVNEPDLPGVIAEEGVSRFYPIGAAITPVVGFVNSVTQKDQDKNPDIGEYKIPGFKHGKEGLELGFDAQLRGRAGTASLEVNAHGRVIREIGTSPPVDGRTLKLTIDLDLQKYAADRFGIDAGAAIVMDTATGALRAMVSAPAADPNLFVNGISFGNWDKLNKDPLQPLINKAFKGLYPPGSTFKMIVAIAALESGITPEETIHCNGRFPYGGRNFHCWKHGGHGTVDLVHSLAWSCDVWYYTMSLRVGIEKIAEVARRFGFGERWDIGIPGMKRGTVPTPAWKRERFGQPWYKGETVNASIGQGYVLSTPFQLAVMAARIASGKVLTPYIVEPAPGESRPEDAPLPVDPAHLDLVRQGMAMVTSPGGTAWNARVEGEGMSIAGKTGTAQVRRISKEERARGLPPYQSVDWLKRDHAFFVAYGPVEAPRYAAAVFVEHGGSGSKVAGPIARDIMRAALTLDGMDRKGDVKAALDAITPVRKLGASAPLPEVPGDAANAAAPAEEEDR